MKNSLKKLLCLCLSLAMIFAFAACGEKKDDQKEGQDEQAWVWNGPKYDDLIKSIGKFDIDLSGADGQLAEILKKGQMVVATSPDYPPAEFVDLATNEIKGAEMLLAQLIANSLGVELVIESMDFSAVLTSVATGKADIAISGLGYKEDRAQQYELSHGYQSGSAAAHHTILVPKADVDKYNSLADFAGKKINAQVNSLQEMYCNDQLKDTELELISTIDQAILNLAAGKVDAVALDSTTARNYMEQSNGEYVSLYEAKKLEFDLSLYADYSGNVIAVKKGETSFIDAVNQVIDKMLATENYFEEYTMYSTIYYSACDAAGVVPGEDE